MATQQIKRTAVQFTFQRKESPIEATSSEHLATLTDVYGQTLAREGETLVGVQHLTKIQTVEGPDPPPPPAPVLPTLAEALSAAEDRLATQAAATADAAALSDEALAQYRTLLAAGVHRDEVARLFGVAPAVVVAVQQRLAAAPPKARGKGAGTPAAAPVADAALLPPLPPD